MAVDTTVASGRRLFGRRVCRLPLRLWTAVVGLGRPLADVMSVSGTVPAKDKGKAPIMVVTRRTSNSEPETPNLRDVIGPQLTETLHQILPGLFAQMKDELLAAVDEWIEAAFTARGSGSGSNSQGQSRASTF
ncbi:hypothetical protein OSB04_019205 [Centaurea solstitialis]|uniref:Uncharacterized protein n=1 Tax=Centaurea solstitialis TaxID=347529 RepID=A0AA38W4U0_9ASTR|nr:hypothetical protein OSB04_019205 [Centaurea solstitialis]